MLSKAGKGALQFAYGVRKGELNILSLPTPDGVLAKAKAIRFWIKTDQATPITIFLNEKDGGHYHSTFTTPKDRWQVVELAPADFVLGEGPNDPKDPDNQLDMDQVESVGLIDVAQFFASAEGDFAKLLNVSEGARNLFLAEFTAAQDSKDDNDKLDLDQVKQLVILDVTGWFGGADADNTLWLNNFRALKSK